MDAYLTILNIIDRLIEKEKNKDISRAETKDIRHNGVFNFEGGLIAKTYFDK